MTTNDEPLNRAREKRERPGWPLRINDRREHCTFTEKQKAALDRMAKDLFPGLMIDYPPRSSLK